MESSFTYAKKGTPIPKQYISIESIEKRIYKLTSDPKIGLIFHLNASSDFYEKNLFSNYFIH